MRRTGLRLPALICTRGEGIAPRGPVEGRTDFEGRFTLEGLEVGQTVKLKVLHLDTNDEAEVEETLGPSTR